MRNPALLAISLLALAAGTALARAERYTYELLVDGKKYEVTLGERFELDFAGGRPFAILRNAPATWAGHGIRFTYPGDMKVRVTDHRRIAGVDQIGIGVRRGDDVTVVLTLRPRGEKTIPREALAEGVRGLRAFTKRNQGGEMKKTPWREKIVGEEREGVRLTATKGEDPQCAGLFAFPFAGRTIAIGFLAPRSRWEEGLAAFRTVAGSLAATKEGEKVEPGAELELTVGSRSYLIDVDEPFEIEGPDGKEFSAGLSRGEKTWAGHGIGFTYPSDMTTRTQEALRRVTIHVEHGNAYFASLQLFLTPGVPPEEAQSLSAKFVRQSVEATGARFESEKTCRKRFLGKVRTGTLLTTKGDDDPHLIEIYAIGIGDRTLAVLFYCRESSRRAAKKAFSKIAKSLSGID
jgi:hypothetical protein